MIEEKGAVLVMIAILSVAILLFAALAIDLAALAASSQQASHSAKYAALTALDAYMRKQGDQATKLTAALDAANAIGEMNLALLQPQSSILKESVNARKAGGPFLIPGRFYSQAPPACDAHTVCGGDIDVPCFVPLSDINHDCDRTPNVGPNAFQVIGEYAQGLRKVFSGVISSKPMALSVNEVAALVPRRGCFIIDISNSMVRDTHRGNDSPPNASLYSFLLTVDNPGGEQNQHDVVWNAMDDSRVNPTALPVPEPSDPRYVRRHYKSDYLVADILKDSDYFSGEFDKHHPSPFEQVGLTATLGEEQWMSYGRGNDSVKYRFDAYRDHTYSGPEPLSTVFDGVRRAIEIQKHRAVTGDQACIIFTDAVLFWPRVFNLTSDFDYLLDHLDLRTPDALREPGHVTLSHMASMVLMPGYGTSSNLRLGVVEALRQFNTSRSGDIPSVDFIVYAGDGIPNCTACLSNDDPNCFPSGCGNNYYHYKQAVRELTDLALDGLFPAKISFSAIIYGAHVRPHTLNIASPTAPTVCLSDEESRKLGNDIVDGGNCSDDAECATAFYEMSDLKPFLPVNRDMYRLTRITGGVWAPIRQYAPGTSCDATCSATSPTMQFTSCETPSKQLEQYIERIMGEGSFMIVSQHSLAP